MDYTECPICRSKAKETYDSHFSIDFYSCPVCGEFEYDEDYSEINANHLSSYLFYNAFYRNNAQSICRYHTPINKKDCDEHKEMYDHGFRIHGLPVHMDSDIVEAWYPKSFAERIDKIILYINDKTNHMGQQLAFSYNSMLSLLFVDRKEIETSSRTVIWRDRYECEAEAKYLLEYLKECAMITYTIGSTEENALFVTLSPKGYARVEEVQRTSSSSRNVLVAMKFGAETNNLREAIRKGIADAGYVAIFIDEVQHNDYITPELLKHIQDSKFVVVDLTHQNNGAYFEEGYAMGLGKSVIQLCQKNTKLHFDIAQKNTIMWEKEEEIPQRLTNRIKATID